jgi:hypothetical protein
MFISGELAIWRGDPPSVPPSNEANKHAPTVAHMVDRVIGDGAQENRTDATVFKPQRRARMLPSVPRSMVACRPLAIGGLIILKLPILTLV